MKKIVAFLALFLLGTSVVGAMEAENLQDVFDQVDAFLNALPDTSETIDSIKNIATLLEQATTRYSGKYTDTPSSYETVQNYLESQSRNNLMQGVTIETDNDLFKSLKKCNETKNICSRLLSLRYENGSVSYSGPMLNNTCTKSLLILHYAVCIMQKYEQLLSLYNKEPERGNLLKLMLGLKACIKVLEKNTVKNPDIPF